MKIILGFLQEALNLVVDGVASGLNFQQVQDMFSRGYMRTYVQWGRMVDLSDSEVFQAPGRRQIADIFNAFFQRLKPKILGEMHQIPIKRLSIDHTFKTSKLVSVL